jgi:hypothetical protein
MAGTIHIRNNATGVIRLYRDEYFSDEIGALGYPVGAFNWTDGNYSCDCNRSMFFAQAAGEDPDDDGCGDERFTAIKVVFDDGREFPLDDQSDGDTGPIGTFGLSSTL